MRMIRIFRSEGGYPTGEFLFFKSDGREIFMERSSVGAETEARRNRQSVVGAVDFLVVARLVFQFEGEARERKNQIGLLKMADIFVDRMDAAALRHAGKGVEGIFPGDVRQQVHGQVIDPLNRPNMEPLDDVLVQGRLQQGAQVIAPVDLLEQGLRIAAFIPAK